MLDRLPIKSSKGFRTEKEARNLKISRVKSVPSVIEC
jgi:hypothetical protein